jgi:hypothetical protein
MNKKESTEIGLLDFIFAEIGQGIADVRQRVVEEGWFGRASPQSVSADSFTPSEMTLQHGQEPTAYRQPSFEELWAPNARSDISPDPIDHGGWFIDR